MKRGGQSAEPSFSSRSGDEEKAGSLQSQKSYRRGPKTLDARSLLSATMAWISSAKGSRSVLFALGMNLACRAQGVAGARVSEE